MGGREIIRARNTHPLFEGHTTLGSILYHAAADPDRTVELVPGEKSGFVFEIDGVRLPDVDHGLPQETFEFDLKDLPLSDDAYDLALELLSEKNTEWSRKKREKARRRTESHRDAEGIDL